MYFSKIIYILLICTAFSLTAHAQVLHGTVFEQAEKGKKKMPVQGAAVRWQATQTGTFTDANGHFELKKDDTIGHNLIVSFLGYETDTLFIKDQKIIELILRQGYALKEVVIERELRGSFLSKLEVGHSEIINQKELIKAACCNLSESFETNPSVEVNFTDAVSGAKQIRLLGLQGTYSPMLFENMPGLRGLASPYGLTFVPGTWIESIQVSKGAGSVVNGYESMAGQINLELVKPSDKNKLFFNAYGDQMGRSEVNLNYTKQLNERFGTAMLLHGDGIFMRRDQNNDGFLDNPLSKQLNFMSRWSYTDNKRMESQFGVGVLWQDRTGGQIQFQPELHRGTTQYYGVGVDTRRLEAYAKTGFIYKGKEYKSVGIQTSAVHHEHKAYFGQLNYAGVQNTFYGNLIYQNILGNTNHKIKTGASILYDGYDESLSDKTLNRIGDTAFARQEIVPGVFGEYSYAYLEKLSAQFGFRADYHNLFGLMLTPRVHLRYTLGEHTTLRGSIGRGYRTPNVWVENASLWASARQIIIKEKPQQEISWNYGGSLVQEFHLNKREGSLAIDFFRTEFENQVITDLDQDPHKVVIYNLDGSSFANSFQTELSYSIVKNFDIKLAYKYYDVRTTYHGILMQKPLQPRQRMMATASYATKFKKWMFDGTAMRYGQSRLPNMTGTDENYKPLYGEAYYIFHFQVTRNFKKWSLYGGSENLLNYRQANPIVSANNPFGPDFDASMVWGPIEGRRIYMGLRYKLEKQ